MNVYLIWFYDEGVLDFNVAAAKNKVTAWRDFAGSNPGRKIDEVVFIRRVPASLDLGKLIKSKNERAKK